MKFLFTTDLHLSPNKPIARKEKTREDWINTQIDKMSQTFMYCRENKIKTLLCGGDVFNHHKFNDSIDFSIKLIRLFNNYSDIDFITLYGNHDLRYHQLENLTNSELGLLSETTTNVKKIAPLISFTENGNNIKISMFNYSEKLVERPTSSAKYKVAVIHENIFESSVPPYMSGYTAQQLAELMPSYDLFLCGHNHQQFVWNNGKQIVVNGGSTMRLNTKQIDYKPAFWEIAIDEDVANPTLKIGNISIVKHEYVIKPDMISDEHLKDKKIETFVESTKDFAEGETFDFRKDVENEMEVRKTVDNVRDIVYTVMEE